MTALTACGASTGKTGPTVPTGPRAEIAVADWLRMAGLADGRLEGIVGAGGNRQAALVGRHRPEGSRWVVVVASHAKQSVAVVPVVELPSRARPHVAKATLLSLAAGPKVLVRADVMFVEEQPPHGFATRTVIVGGERPIVLLDRLSEVGSDEAQKRALVSAADVDGDGRWELVFDEKRGREKKKVVYRLGDAGYETRDASLFLDP